MVFDLVQGARRTTTLAFVALVLVAAPVAAEFDQEVVAASHVGVNVYADGRLARTATGIVVGAETVLTDAEVTGRGQRHTVVLATGAEFTAKVTHEDDSRSLAVLNVPGLEAPPLSFALEEVAADEDRFVFAATLDPNNKTPGAAFTFPKGSVSRADDFTPRGAAGSTLPLYEHNVQIKAVGFGGSLLNNCGELIGVNRPGPNAGGWLSDVLRDPEGVAFATRLGSLRTQLDAWSIEYQQVDSDCPTDAEVAAQQAEEKKKEAEAAQQELEEARAREEEALAREKEIAEAAEAAKKAGDESRAEAEEAQRQAEEAQRLAEEAAAEVEAAQARRQEAEEEAEAARQAAEEESTKLQKAKDAAERQEAESFRNLLIVLTAGGIALAVALGLFAFKSRQKNRQLAAEQQKAKQAASDLADAESNLAEMTRQGNFPDCLFEGADSQGAKFALKIPGADLSATVDGVIIGRSPGRSTFVIDSPSVSRAHCRLKYSDDALHISDMNSSNGVLVNDAKLVGEETRLLRDGDRVTLGDVELTLRYL